MDNSDVALKSVPKNETPVVETTSVTDSSDLGQHQPPPEKEAEPAPKSEPAPEKTPSEEKPKEEIIELLLFLKQFNKPLWIFTRFDIGEIDKDILDLLDYIKCGMYKEELTVKDNVQFGINLATSNQKIYKMRE